MSRDEKLARQMFAISNPRGCWEGYAHSHKHWISLAQQTRELVLAEAQEKKRKTKKPAQMSDGEMAIWTATFAVEYRRQTLGLEGVSSHVTPSQIVKMAVNLATSAVFAARDAKPAECSLDAAEREFLGEILNPHRQRKLA